MKCGKSLKILVLVLLLGLLPAVSYGSPLDAQTLLKFESELMTLEQIYKQLSMITVNSGMTLEDLQTILPQLVQRVLLLETELQTSIGLLKVDLDQLDQTSSTLMERWLNLKDGIGKLSSSVATLETSFMNLDESLKKQEAKSNWGLGISIGAGVAAILALIISIFKK